MRLPIVILATAVSLAAQDTSSIRASLQRLLAGEPSAQQDLRPDSPVRTAAMAMDTTSSEEARLAAATWLWQANIQTGFSYGPDMPYLKAVQRQPDLLKAWSLLESLGEAKARERDALMLELGWRLMDPGRMRVAFDRVTARSPLDIRELTHCFMVSLHLGKWEAAKGFGAELVSRGANFAGFHHAAEENLTSFDYESLYNAILGQAPTAPALPLPVRSWRVIRWRTRIKEVNGSHRALVRAASNMPRAWTDKPDAPVDLLQVGAAAHWVEGSAQPPVSGFISTDRIYLVGYRESREGPDPGVQVQTWDMRSEPAQPRHWRGLNTLIVRLANATDNKAPALVLSFENEWDLIPGEPGPEKTLDPP